MRYTFEQTFEDHEAVRRLILARQSWRRPLIIVLLLGVVAICFVPLLGADPPPLHVLALNVAPYVFIALLWTAVFSGYTRPALIVAGLGAVALMAIVGVLAVQQGASTTAIFMNLLPYGFLLALFAGLFIYVRQRAFRKNPLFQGDVTMELTPEELRVLRPDYTSAHRWSAIVRATETPAFFLFFYTKACAYYLPKRAVPPADLPDLRTFVRAHVLSGLL